MFWLMIDKLIIFLFMPHLTMIQYFMASPISFNLWKKKRNQVLISQSWSSPWWKYSFLADVTDQSTPLRLGWSNYGLRGFTLTLGIDVPVDEIPFVFEASVLYSFRYRLHNFISLSLSVHNLLTFRRYHLIEIFTEILPLKNCVFSFQIIQKKILFSLNPYNH